MDWFDKIVFVIGVSQTSATLPIMVRCLVPPIAGYISYILFDM